MADTNLSAHPQALYRFYSDDGVLLYVGITASPSGRFRQHGQDKAWWPEVRGITVEWYPDRRSVLAAETRAISVENPTYNVVRPALPENVSREVATNDDGGHGLIEWSCVWCEGEIEDGDGFLAVSGQELFEARHSAAVHDAEERASESLPFWRPYPEAARWRTAHDGCDPSNGDDDAYYIEIHRARTFPQLLWWTAHLAGKNWLQDTNWMPMVRRIAAAERGGK